MVAVVDTIPIDTAAEFFDRLRPQLGQTETLVYRGVGDAVRHALVPQFFRRWYQPPSSSSLPLAQNFIAAEVALLQAFVAACDLSGLPLPRDYFDHRDTLRSFAEPDAVDGIDVWPPTSLVDVMVVAQHHGLHTRLLDWSRSSIVACYFAAASALSNEAGTNALAVWALDETVPQDTANGDGDGLFLKITAPGSHSRNLAAQFGLFTMTRHEVKRDQQMWIESVDELVARRLGEPLEGRTSAPLTKYILPRREAANLLELCELYGVTGATMFPGYDGAARAAMQKVARLRAQYKAPGQL